MTNLGSLNYFLGIDVNRDDHDIFLSQQKYTKEIVERVNMLNCKTTETIAKFDGTDPPISDPTLYSSLAGALQYLTFTRPYITYVVQ